MQDMQGLVIVETQKEGSMAAGCQAKGGGARAEALGRQSRPGPSEL